ncbi:hypothetical protein GCM10009651_36510 [Microbacterium natoriense]
MTECDVVHLIDHDSLWCTLNEGHAGPHKTLTEDGDVWWQKDIQRRHTHE